MISTMDSLNNSNTSHNTRTMAFKQTLKLQYNDNIIKTFNHSSKLTFKLAKASCHISFLKSCRDFSITPKGLTLSDPLKSCIKRNPFLLPPDSSNSNMITPLQNPYTYPFFSNSRYPLTTPIIMNTYFT